MSANGTLLECENLSREFRTSAGAIRAVDAASLEVNKGETVVVNGASGSGKTTLLLMASALLRPTQGTLRLFGELPYERSRQARAKLRRHQLATVLPTFHLLPYLNVLANVRLGHPHRSRDEAVNLLKQLGLGERLHHRPDQLSTGERRRVMVARALLSGAPLLLADEPTSNLDEESAALVRQAIHDHVQQGGSAFIVTHDDPGQFQADQVYRMQAGKLSRAGRSSGWLVIALASILVMVGLVAMMLQPDRNSARRSNEPIRLICAAGIKPAVEATIAQYESETGNKVNVSYGGSGTLLGQLKIDPDSADLYLAADDSYVTLARNAELTAESIPLAKMTPVIAVAKGNPEGVKGLKDLMRDDLRLGLANPDAAAIGKISRKALTAADVWKDVEANVQVFKPTVNEIANDLKLGTIDIGIVWDATVNQYEELEAVRVPELDAFTRTVAVTVVAATNKPTAALHFARYLAARDRGNQHFAKMGYETVQGDVWADRPELLVFAGSMFNKPVDDTIRAFEEREGVEVDRVYNGCGILVSQMQAGGNPDAYLSCDTSFMDRVSERFRSPVQLSENPMVIIVQPGNPHEIKTLEDLLKPDIRLGLAHPEKSALGALTQRMLKEQNLLKRLEESGNWVQDQPQGDFLTNSMKAEALDAAIVYQSNAQPWTDDLELIPIDVPGSIAHQPAAVAVNTEHAQLAERFLDAVRTKESAEKFRELGFTWLDDLGATEEPR